jgi:LysR family transcriptional activator of mexEF-oprN operon
VFDPRQVNVARMTLARYLEHDHVVVSYNADLRGVVEDSLGIERRVRVAVPSFRSVGTLLDGSALVATVPAMVARELVSARPHLETRPLPFELPSSAIEMLWMRATDDDEALAFVRRHVAAIARDAASEQPRGARAAASVRKAAARRAAGGKAAARAEARKRRLPARSNA